MLLQWGRVQGELNSAPVYTEVTGFFKERMGGQGGGKWDLSRDREVKITKKQEVGFGPRETHLCLLTGAY